MADRTEQFKSIRYHITLPGSVAQIGARRTEERNCGTFSKYVAQLVQEERDREAPKQTLPTANVIESH